jgi:putative transposase
MTVNSSIDPARMLEEQRAQASPDLLRELLGTFIATMLSAEADSVCGGAGFGQSSPERVNSRNGYRHRDFDTRAGTLDIAIPKPRQGSYFPEWQATHPMTTGVHRDPTLVEPFGHVRARRNCWSVLNVAPLT